MRLALVILVALIGIFALGTAAEAQNYPWCAQYTGNMGGAMNCGFSTHQQCMENVSGIGGFCIVNNTYVPPPGPVPVHRQARKHHGRAPS